MKPPSTTSSNAVRKPVPGWVILLILVGVPAAIITIGLSMGGHIMELVMFSLLCLCGLALVFFMR